MGPKPDDVLRAIDAVVVDVPAAVPGRVPPVDWEGWEIVIDMLGLQYDRHVVALAREAAFQAQKGTGQSGNEPCGNGQVVDDRHGGIKQLLQDCRVFTAVGQLTRIVCDVKMNPGVLLYQLKDVHFSAWLTEAVLRDVFGSAAEPLLASWRTLDGLASRQALPAASPFDPEAANALLGPLESAALQHQVARATPPAPGGSPRVRSPRAAPPTEQTTAPPTAQQPGSDDRQQAGLEQGQAGGQRATASQLPAGGPLMSPQGDRPQGDRPGLAGGRGPEGAAAAISHQQEGRRSLEQYREEPQGEERQRLLPPPPQEVRSPPVHTDDHDPNSSYCDPEAAAALGSAFKEAFARAYQRKRQRVQEEVVMARHSALYGAGRGPGAGRPRQAAALAQAVGGDGDDGFGVGPTQQVHRGGAVASGAATCGALSRGAVRHVAPAHVAVALAQERRDGLEAAETGTAPRVRAVERLYADQQQRQQQQQEKPRVQEQEVMVMVGNEQGEGGRQGQQEGLDGSDPRLRGGAAADANADADGLRSGEEDHAQRPRKRRRQELNEDTADVEDGNNEGGGMSAQRHAAPRQQQSQIVDQPQAEEQPRAPTPALVDLTAGPSTPYTSGTSAGVTISSARTPATLESPTEAGEPDAKGPPSEVQKDPQRYHPGIIPDAHAEAAWTKLGEILRAARAASKSQHHRGHAAPRPPMQRFGHTIAASAGRELRLAGGEAAQPEVGTAPAGGLASPAGGEAATPAGVEVRLGGCQADGGRQATPRTAGAAVPPQGTTTLAGGASADAATSPRPRSQLPQSPVGSHRRLPASFLCRGLPRGTHAHAGTRASPNCPNNTQGFQGASPGATAGPALGVSGGPANQRAPCAESRAPGAAATSLEEAFEEPVGTQQDFAEEICTQLGTQSCGAGQESEGAPAAPQGAAGQQLDGPSRARGAPKTMDCPAGRNEEAEGGETRCTRQARSEDEGNAPLKDQLRMCASQCIQTSQRLLDSWILDLQLLGRPVNRTAAVQTTQIGAQVHSPQPFDAQPQSASQSQQGYHLGALGPRALTESPLDSADGQPISSQGLPTNQAGTVVGVTLASPEAHQQAGKGSRQVAPASCRAAGGGATMPGAAPASSTLAGAQSTSMEHRAGQIPADDRGDGTAAAETSSPTVAHRVDEPTLKASEPTADSVPDVAAGVGRGPAIEPMPSSVSSQDTSTTSAAPSQRQQQEAALTCHTGTAASAPRYGRLARGGIPLRDVQAWLGRACAPLVAPNLVQDTLDVRNVAVGIRSWPDVTMSVLRQLHNNPPPPPQPPPGRPPQGHAAGAVTYGDASWQDYWLEVHVPSLVHEASELEGFLLRARDVLGGPSSLDGPAMAAAAEVATLEEAMWLMAEHRAGAAAAVAASAHVDRDAGAAGEQEQPNKGAASPAPSGQMAAELPPRTQQEPVRNARIGDGRTAGGEGNLGEAMPSATMGEDDRQQSPQDLLQGAGGELHPGSPVPLTQDFEFVLQSAPPDFFTQAF